MAQLTDSEAKDLLKEVLGELWKQEKGAILGARLKATLLNTAGVRGSEFSERSLGYGTFAAFLSASGLAKVRPRPGTDILVAPIEHAEALEQEGRFRQRIRQDFWEAFVSFPAPNDARGYDPRTDRIQKGPPPLPQDAKPITPISRQTQIEWRQAFLDTLGPDNTLMPLRGNLTDPGGLGHFTMAVMRQGLRTRWNTYLQERVAEVVRAWAVPAGIPDSVWLGSYSGPTPPEQSARADLYRLLDKIPLQKLLELNVPLGWLIDQDPD